MQISPKIHLLNHPFEIHMPNGQKIPRSVNSVLILGREITLIDSGTKDSLQDIFSYIEKQGRRVSEIKLLILSHSHPDHIGSAAKIKELTHCKVLAHRAEKDWIENIDLQLKNRPVPGFYELADHSVQLDGFLDDGQELELDPDLHIQIIHSPGHSSGSINIQFIEDKILFTADSIPLKNDIPNYDNYFLLMDSLEKISNNTSYNLLISSWVPTIVDRQRAFELITEGREYLKAIDDAVQKHYGSDEEMPFEFCDAVIKQMNMPVFFKGPICDKAFKTHFP